MSRCVLQTQLLGFLRLLERKGGLAAFELGLRLGDDFSVVHGISWYFGSKRADLVAYLATLK